ncbi:MAG: hypothetical protein AAFV86_15915 [Pseudomonadota bacterium]
MPTRSFASPTRWRRPFDRRPDWLAAACALAAIALAPLPAGAATLGPDSVADTASAEFSVPSVAIPLPGSNTVLVIEERGMLGAPGTEGLRAATAFARETTESLGLLPQPVPVPGGLPVLLTALAALGAVASRRRP